jgi:hypothetical protein
VSADLLSGLWRAPAQPVLASHDWERLLSQARRCRLEGRLAVLFEDRGWLQSVPERPRQHLLSALVAAHRQHEQVRWEIDRVRAAMAGQPGPVVLLKGAAYVALQLPPARGRLFTDVDIMVPREAIGRAETTLLGCGWVHEQLDPYDERYYRRWMHELPPLKHVWRQTWLDLHHTITPPTSRFAVDGNQLLAQVRPIAPGSQLACLAPTDMVLHSAVHLLQEGDFTAGLRDLLDLDDLLRHFAADPLFWPALFDRARLLGLQVPLHHVLGQLDRLFGTLPPPELRARAEGLATGWASRRCMPRLLQLALQPPGAERRPRATAAARWMLYVRSHWLRMPWYRILPHLARKAWTRAQGRLQRSASAA